MQVDCKLFRRILIRQHKAQMKRKSKEIQEALVRHDYVHGCDDRSAMHVRASYWSHCRLDKVIKFKAVLAVTIY